MRAWATALVALAVGSGAVIASLVATRPDEAQDLRPDAVPARGEPAFTVIDEAEREDATPTPTSSPQPTVAPARLVAGRAPDPPAPAVTETPRARQRRGHTRVSVISGEHSDSSTGEDDEEQTDD